MANSHSPSPSPSSSQDPTNRPSLLLAAPPQISTATSRRLPPPCWSQEETAALIDAYHDKWYSLRRGNLRTSHWQEVANDIASRCPLSSRNPQKTSIQCRHKMEKLRKHYRAKIQRASGTPKGHRYPSSWVHFKRMDSIEKGSNSSDPTTESMNQDEDEESEERDFDNQDGLLLYPRGIKQVIPIPANQRFYNSIDNGNENGFGIKFPGQVPSPAAGLNWGKPNYGVDKGLRDGYVNSGFRIGEN